MKLRDPKAFITGASRGIGRAIALAFAEEGAVLALGARSMDSLEKLAAEIEADGGKAVPIQIDIGSGSSIANAQAAVGEKLGDIHIVVNNAGIARSVKVLDMDDEHWQSHLDINLTGTFRVTRGSCRGSSRKVGVVSSISHRRRAKSVFNTRPPTARASTVSSG